MWLAHHKGMTVEEAQERFSLDEFFDWIAYERIHPFDYPEAMITSAVLSVFGGKSVDPMSLTLFGRYEGSEQKSDDTMKSIIGTSGVAKREYGKWLVTEI